MKKILVALALIFVTNVMYAQSYPKFENDTIFYSKSKIYVGDTIYLGYGSSDNKDFTYVLYGSNSTMVPSKHLESKYHNQPVVINKVYKKQGKYIARGEMYELNTRGVIKLFIDVEGAIENEELKEKK